MKRFSEELFQALLVEFIVALIALASSSKVNQVLLIGLATLLAATIAFLPKVSAQPIQPRVPHPSGLVTIAGYSVFVLWFQWVLIGAIANATAWVFSNRQWGMIRISSSTTVNILPGIIVGMVAGILQWLILRKHFQLTGQWILNTLLGWTAASLIAVPLLTINHEFARYLDNALLGLIIGYSQWLLLRKYFSLTSWWIIANIANWLIARPVAQFLSNVTWINQHWELVSTSAIYGALIGVTATFISGIVLARIVQKRA